MAEIILRTNPLRMMKSFQLVFLLATSLCCTDSYAVSFEPVGQARSVQISGQINSFNFETQSSQSAVFNDSSHALPVDWDPLRMGMDISIPDSNCFAQGVASHSITAGGNSIEFSGLADVNISGFAGYPYELEGSGGAMSSIDYSFRVAEHQMIELFMSSSVGYLRDEDYLFSLQSSNGALVWGSTGVVNEYGELERTFTRRMMLAPGDYTVSAKLTASSYLAGGTSFAGRTWADFSITAVPEPNSLLLATVGAFLAWVLSTAKKRFR